MGMLARPFASKRPSSIAAVSIEVEVAGRREMPVAVA
jgi:hypothetical protein